MFSAAFLLILRELCRPIFLWGNPTKMCLIGTVDRPSDSHKLPRQTGNLSIYLVGSTSMLSAKFWTIYWPQKKIWVLLLCYLKFHTNFAALCAFSPGGPPTFLDPFCRESWTRTFNLTNNVGFFLSPNMTILSIKF